MTLILTEENYDEVTLSSDCPVLVDFWAQRCEHCLALAATIDKLAEAYKGKAIVAKLNADEFPTISKKCTIMGLPTVIIYSNAVEKERLVCGKSFEEYAELLDKYI